MCAVARPAPILVESFTRNEAKELLTKFTRAGSTARFHRKPGARGTRSHALHAHCRRPGWAAGGSAATRERSWRGIWARMRAFHPASGAIDRLRDVRQPSGCRIRRWRCRFRRASPAAGRKERKASTCGGWRRSAGGSSVRHRRLAAESTRRVGRVPRSLTPRNAPGTPFRVPRARPSRPALRHGRRPAPARTRRSESVGGRRADAGGAVADLEGAHDRGLITPSPAP